MHDVFISYSSQNQEKAEEIRRILEENGITCWYAPKNIHGTENFRKVIPPAIRQAKAFLLLVSEDSQNSKWVPRELGEADECDCPIYTLFLEDCELKDEFKFVLRFNQHYPASLGLEEQMRLLVKELLSDMQKSAATPQITLEKTDPPKKASAPKTKLFIGLAAATMAVIVLVTVLLIAGGKPSNGSYVIWNPTYNTALSCDKTNSHYLAGVTVVGQGDKLTGYTNKCVWTLTFESEDTFTISRDGVTLGVEPGYNGVGLGGDYTADRWTLTKADDGLYLIRNTETGYYLEWYAQKNNWTTYNNITDENRDQFLVRFDSAA